nr:MAG TPA: hypothetical protein [Caudoviricetes sp.]
MLSVKRESLSNSLKNISANLWRHVAHIALLVGVVSSSPRPALFPCFVSAAWRTISPPFRSAAVLLDFAALLSRHGTAHFSAADFGNK